MESDPQKNPQPPLSLETLAQVEATIVFVHGRLTAGVTDVLRDEVKRLIPQNTRIVLDLTDLAYMDSTGLGTIVSLFVSARAAGCRLELINLSQRVSELLRVTKLLSMLNNLGEHDIRIF